MSPRDELRASKLFAHLEPAHLELLAADAVAVEWPPGTVPEDRCAGCFLLLEGTLALRRQTPYGPYLVRRPSAGDLIGETAWLGRAGQPNEVVVETALRALRLPSALAPSWPAGMTLALLWALWKSQAAKLRAANNRLAGFFQPDGARAADAATPSADPDGSIHVDLEAKRGLFAEQRLSNLEINFLTTLSSEKRYRHGEALFREGDPAASMFVVLDGRVRISKHIPGVGEEALSFLERGAYFGEMALFDRQPRSASAVAHDGDVIVLALPREVVGGLLDVGRVSSPRLLRLLCNMLARRLEALDDKLAGWHVLAAGSPPAPG